MFLFQMSIPTENLLIYCDTTPVFSWMWLVHFSQKNVAWCSFWQNRWKGNLSHANRLPEPFFVMKDASVWLDGGCPTHTAAAHHAPGIRSPRPPPNPPPLSTTVQQQDPWGALLARTPTHGTPWCQNTEHSGITQTAQSRANRQKLSKITRLCSQISTCPPASLHV